MKKIISLMAITFLIVPFLMSADSFADWSQKAQVIKTDNDNHDTIIKKVDGSRWLIQHNRSCTSISTEFPVTLIMEKDEIVDLKVNFNEICEVYNAVPYDGQGELVRVIRSDNQLIRDHEAEIIWNGKKHLVDFDDSCRMYDFEGENIYYSFADAPKNGGNIILPSARGVCPFTFEETVEVIEENPEELPGQLKGLQYEERNNMVYFYWKPMPEDQRWLYVLSYSRYKLELDSYTSWREMPNIRITRRNSYTKRGLKNDRTYHFYLAAVNEKGEAGPWSHIEATPEFTGEKIVNNPDFDPFEITVKEEDGKFRFDWPYRDDARRIFVRFYIDGKPQYFRILKPDHNFYEIPIEESYIGKGLKFTVRTIPYPMKPRYSDGIFWEYEG